MLQVGSPELPLRVTVQLSPLDRVKSLRFRVGLLVEELPLELPDPPEVTELITLQEWLTPLGRVAVLVTVPRLLPGLTVPLASTDTISGWLLLQVTVPVVPAGE